MPSVDDLSDVELVHRIVAGDAGAADLFVERFTRLVWWHLVHQMQLGPELAEEIYQDVWVRLWQENYRRLRNWEGDGDFAPYLKAVVRNLALDHIRRVHPGEPLPGPEESGRLPEDPGPSPEDLAWVQQQRDLIERALASMEARDRHLYELRFELDYSYEEIAATLSITRNNVGVRLNRLVKHLRGTVGGGFAVRSSDPGPSSDLGQRWTKNI